jgi:hypothetical protein
VTRVDRHADAAGGRRGTSGRAARGAAGAADVADDGTETEAEAPTRTLVELERVSRYLDDLFVVPGTGYRIGLDPLLGLVPGVGDVVTSAASAYIVAQAAAAGVPRATLARMLIVLLVDAVVGSLPLVGDVFDAVWKANARNVGLAESRLARPAAATADRRYVAAVTVGVTLALVAVGLGAGVAAWWALGRIGP